MELKEKEKREQKEREFADEQRFQKDEATFWIGSKQGGGGDPLYGADGALINVKGSLARSYNQQAKNIPFEPSPDLQRNQATFSHSNSNTLISASKMALLSHQGQPQGANFNQTVMSENVGSSYFAKRAEEDERRKASQRDSYMRDLRKQIEEQESKRRNEQNLEKMREREEEKKQLMYWKMVEEREGPRPTDKGGEKGMEWNFDAMPISSKGQNKYELDFNGVSADTVPPASAFHQKAKNKENPQPKIEEENPFNSQSTPAPKPFPSSIPNEAKPDQLPFDPLKGERERSYFPKENSYSEYFQENSKLFSRGNQQNQHLASLERLSEDRKSGNQSPFIGNRSHASSTVSKSLAKLKMQSFEAIPEEAFEDNEEDAAVPFLMIRPENKKQNIFNGPFINQRVFEEVDSEFLRLKDQIKEKKTSFGKELTKLRNHLTNSQELKGKAQLNLHSMRRLMSQNGGVNTQSAPSLFSSEERMVQPLIFPLT